MPKSASKLFSPLQLGALTLKHRVVLAPLTRVRSPEHIPGEYVAEYYKQRASDGGLLISEAINISIMGGNYKNTPGIDTPSMCVPGRRLPMPFIQREDLSLPNCGITTTPENLGGRTPVGPSATILEGAKVAPRALTIEEIKDTVSDFVHAAKCAIEAGFDGVEVVNQYGGSVENRARFPLEVVDAVAAAVGPERTGFRLSPFGFFQGTNTSDIIRDYGYVVSELEKRGLSFVQLTEPRSDLTGSEEAKVQRLKDQARASGTPEDDVSSLKAFREILKNTPLISTGSFNDKNSFAPVDNGEIDAIAYGRYFISNPDLPERLRKGYPLAPYDRGTFYTQGLEGYIDYPTYEEQQVRL
ncbi:hypothetical protein RUND412_000233 [Rhizina undulata]